jgi:Kelch motif
MRRKIFFAVTVFLLALTSVSRAQTLQNLVHQPPNGAGLGFLLTDGTVMFQGNDTATWSKLTPDSFGSYLNGTWSQLASLPSGYSPDAFASSVLANGRVVIVGGEYNFGTFVLTNQGATYDPIANTWTSLPPPAGWDFIGDSPSLVLPDGKFLIGNKLDKRMALLDPGTLTWKPIGIGFQASLAGGKRDFNAEEGWTLLPDGTVLTFDVQAAPHSEKFIYSRPIGGSVYQTWVTAGSTIVDLHSPSQFGCLPYGDHGQFCYFPPGEVGPAILRPNGTVFATGSNSAAGPGHTAIYTPPAVPTDPGTWTPGPDFPNGDNAGDSFAALLPNGNVLVLGNSGELYQFDGVNLIPELNASGALLVLPTGQVVVANNTVRLYTPSNVTYLPSWAPTITTYPGTVVRGSTYQIFGKQFNGLSQAAAFGDEDETATNYPLVRITNQSTGHVFYARTHGHSTMAVATGNATVSTNFDVPAGMETGASSLQVVANGIPSPAVAITVL